MQKLAILIPVFNAKAYTEKCLENLFELIEKSIFPAEYIEIIVIDDGSTDGTEAFVKGNFPKVIVLKGNGNLWWSGAVNMGAEFAISQRSVDYILLWNNDVTASADFFDAVFHKIQEGKTNIVYGAKVYTSEERKVVWSMGGTFNHRNGDFTMIGYNQPDSVVFEREYSCNWLPGMGTLIHKSVVEKIGYWDNINFPQYHGDSDYTYRAFMNGFKIIALPDLVVWNDTTHTGLRHKGSFKNLIASLSDVKSLYNVKVNLIFFKKYAKGVFAYNYLFRMYLYYFGGFLKWKFLEKIGIEKHANE